MIIEGEDGVNFINIYSKASSSLGRWLSNFTYAPIQLNGKTYLSIETLWFYDLTGNDEILKYYGYKAKEIGSKFPRVKEINQQLIKDALDVKIKTYPDKMLELAQTTLPLTHQYQYGDKWVDAKYDWIPQHFELRRQQLKEYYKI